MRGCSATCDGESAGDLIREFSGATATPLAGARIRAALAICTGPGSRVGSSSTGGRLARSPKSLASSPKHRTVQGAKN
jgi:hypothetical protein